MDGVCFTLVENIKLTVNPLPTINSVDVQTEDNGERNITIIADGEEPFTYSLLYLLGKIKNLNTFLIDANKVINNLPERINSFNNDLDKFIPELYKFVDGVNENNLNDYKDTLFVILYPSELLEKLNNDNKKVFGDILQKISNIPKFNFILVEQTNNNKKLEFELWYKDTVNTSRGIFLGNGIDNQMSIKLTKIFSCCKNFLSVFQLQYTIK